MIRQEDVFKIGQFAKPHGIKGEISLVTQSDVFDEAENPYLICDINGILVPFFIEEYRYKSDTVILVKLENINSDQAAREFTNRDVFYPLDEMDEENDLIGDITWDSLVGYQVTDEKHGDLGTITDVDESTINVLLHIRQEEKEILVPAVEEIIVAADHTDKRTTVSVPEGLLDL
ncbi:MAG: ribosome maturation factor RimM [Tannerellaceae bacterium]|nr:ribosome maturation factor RimM [Tannerellaceae bacterium]MCD7712883.1 ribosome maturation factor RimM [Bacillota bacterium]